MEDFLVKFFYDVALILIGHILYVLSDTGRR